MDTHLIVLIGSVTAGFIFGTLKVKWDFLKKTGTHIEDYLDNFK